MGWDRSQYLRHGCWELEQFDRKRGACPRQRAADLVRTRHPRSRVHTFAARLRCSQVRWPVPTCGHERRRSHRILHPCSLRIDDRCHRLGSDGQHDSASLLVRYGIPGASGVPDASLSRRVSARPPPKPLLGLAELDISIEANLRYLMLAGSKLLNGLVSRQIVRRSSSLG